MGPQHPSTHGVLRIIIPSIQAFPSLLVIFNEIINPFQNRGMRNEIYDSTIGNEMDLTRLEYHYSGLIRLIIHKDWKSHSEKHLTIPS